MAWLNSDGLYVKFGTEKVETSKGGQLGNENVIEFDISYTDLEAFGTDTFLSDTVTVPNGAFIEDVKFIVTTAWTSGGSATLTFGLYDQDRSTAIDVDGLDATIAKAALAAQAVISCDGALVKTRLTNSGLVTAQAGTANFTAGAGKLRITYFI